MQEHQAIKKIRIGILSSFLSEPLKQILEERCLVFGIQGEIYLGQYGQYVQETLNKEGDLYRFEPDIIVLFIDTMTLLGDLYFFPYSISEEERKKWVETKLQEINDLVRMLLAHSSARIVLHNFATPPYSPLGILENREGFGFHESVETLNSRLRDCYKSHERVYLFDYNRFCSNIGYRTVTDPKMYYLGDLKVSNRAFRELADEYIAYILPTLSLSKKCLVLDLDNTLWGGVIGEDGLEGIKLGNYPEGKPFLEFQKRILSLHQRGVILAINSKNNMEDAIEVFRTHPEMILKEEHFTSIKANWNDKITNLKEIAQELRLGIDSFVVFDDDMTMREMIKEFLPEVTVIDVPQDPALYPSTIEHIVHFNTFSITQEDKKRGELYRTDKKRESLRLASGDIEQFLHSLGLRMILHGAEKVTIPRIAQLTQKTNQCNITTRRYFEDDIAKMASSPDHLVLCIEVNDIYGSYGITGVVIIQTFKEEWSIDSFLLSCRILGKNIEYALITYIIKKAAAMGVVRIIGEFLPTKKNAPAKNFFGESGFHQKSGGDIEAWVFDISTDTYREFPYIHIDDSQYNQ